MARIAPSITSVIVNRKVTFLGMFSAQHRTRPFKETFPFLKLETPVYESTMLEKTISAETRYSTRGVGVLGKMHVYCCNGKDGRCWGGIADVAVATARRAPQAANSFKSVRIRQIQGIIRWY